MKKITLAVLITTGAGWAQSALFLNMGAGGRELGLGGAVVAITQGPGACFWNPAGVALGPDLGIFAQHAEHFYGIRYDNLALSKSFGFGSLALSGGGLYVGGFEGRTGPSPSPEWEFSCFDFYTGLTYAKKLGDFSLGATGKFFMGKIDKASGTSFVSDLGALYLTKYLNLGLSLRNLGPGITYESETSPMPTGLDFGIGVKPLRYLLLTGSMTKPFHWNKLQIKAGSELRIADILSLRAGYSNELSGEFGDDALGYSALSSFWFGAGVAVEDIDLDYAFRSYDFLGYAHRISLTYSPGRSAAVNAVEWEQISKEYQKKARITAESFYSSAMDYYGNGNLDEALANLDRALVWDPEFTQAQEMYDKISQEKKIKDADAYYNRGLELYNQGNFVDAITQFEKCLELNPDHSLAAKWQENAFTALVEVQKDKYKKKKAQAQEISDLMKQGVSYYSKGKYSKAEAKFKKVLELDPANSEAKEYLAKSEKTRKNKAKDYIRKAEASAAKKNYARAVKYYKMALKYDPSNPDANQGLAEARQAAAKAASEHLASGKKLYNQGNLSGAESEFRTALSLDPGLTEAKTYLSEISKKRKSSSTKAANPEVVQELYLKGVDAYVKEDYENAAYYWEKVLELDPNHSKAKANLAKAKKRLKK